MLGKLIKYEWKSMYKAASIMLGVVILMTILISAALRLPPVVGVFRSGVSSSDPNFVPNVLMVIGLMISFIACILLLVGVMYAMYIYIGVHFYKSMYTDQGYLTHTLPVSPHQLLISKTLVSGLWIVLTQLVLFISIFVLVFSLMATVSPAESAEMFRSLADSLDELWQVLGVSGIRMMVSILLVLTITPFSTVLMLFGSFTIGQLSRKYKALMGVLTLIGIYIAHSILMFMIQMLVMMNVGILYETIPASYLAIQYDISTVCNLAIGGGLYLVSYRIIKRRLNLE